MNTGGDVPDDPASRFERFYADSVTALLGFCLRRCESREDAADLVSEVFLVAWRRIEEIPEGDEARLWLFGVAHRLLANQERASRRQRNLGARLERYLDEVDAPDPAAVLDRHEAGRPVREALATLAPQDGALLTLVAWEGLSPTEAGRVVGLSAGTARVRLFRARGRLRAALAASDADPDLVPTSRTQSVPTGIKEA